MHRIAATPGGWNPNTEGVIFLEQTPAPIVILTTADTEIQTLAGSCDRLPADFPEFRVANLLQLQQELSIDTYVDEVLMQAQVIVVRLLGGRNYWNYGLDRLYEIANDHGIKLIVLPGDDRPDPALVSLCTVPLAVGDRLWHYFVAGGIENLTHALQYIAHTCLDYGNTPPPPQSPPQWAIYPFDPSPSPVGTTPPCLSLPLEDTPRVGILFYRAHYLAGNTAVIDALSHALVQTGLVPVPIFIPSLRDESIQAELLQFFKTEQPLDILINTTGFSLAKLTNDAPQIHFWQQLDIPVLQVILSGGSEEQWQQQWRGLSPRDIAMNVALPEVDGRIISRAISFKAVQSHHPRLETAVVGYEPKGDRLTFVAELAANWAKLRRSPPSERKIALILANYPNKDGRLANGVGLDTPASCMAILRALKQSGYWLDSDHTPLPDSSDDLMQRLTAGRTNDPEGWELRPVRQVLTATDYQRYFRTLPDAVQQAVCDRWGAPPEKDIAIAGLQFGNVFVGIQPSRGYDHDPALNYHAPDLEPTHDYLAFYFWLRFQWQVGAIAHVGKHGNLEWLPGKSIALSESCYPEVALGPLPHLYPFIVNDPGEGTQAKRRSQAVIIDHLTPPLTRAELYGPLQQLESLIDEYYDAQALDPKRLPVIRDRICHLVTTENLDQDLSLLPKNLKHTQELLINSQRDPIIFQEFVTSTDGYLCELKEAQIRDGLHIFGQCPKGRQLRDLVVAIARQPDTQRQGLTRAIAQDWGWAIDPLTDDLGQAITDMGGEDAGEMGGDDQGDRLRTVGDAVERLEAEAARLVEELIAKRGIDSEFLQATGNLVRPELEWIAHYLLPALRQTHQEIDHLLHGLAGGYVPSGASGAPTRGRADVLPTGRNFYSVDIRGLPTESAWDVGRRAAETLVEHYTQENGEYPKTLGLSVWGTSTMRTGGDDIAEALALLGVQPVWSGAARRVLDFEILPLSRLGRPRVDVILRISGFFRDAFPNLIDLFNAAVAAIAQLDEPAEMNPIAAQVQQEVQEWQAAGLEDDLAVDRALYRVFGSKPGAYGAGLQGLIEAQNWNDDADLAQAYINWSCYAYGRSAGRKPDRSSDQSSSPSEFSSELPSKLPSNLAYSPTDLRTTAVPDVFQRRLQTLQIVLHNQDNREHDLLDSDDYYQFQGGLVAAVRHTQGQNPTTYFGDHSQPAKPRVRSLQGEISRVYRSRVVNPKWIAGVMRHGYKGAFELAATVDYLFAYDATAHCVADFMYTGVAEAYVLNSEVQQFVQQHNPWALRDMAERLLEAHQRGLWQQPPEEMVDQLRAIALDAEADIETTLHTQ
ncbi:MAG: cobaltochelatase subunit CobN [Leptolyngbyaceae bacterium]|nr:cobaltochelatase subunit CobN [Leptolyngbyaceae bacterium]